jgi:hypothetical protein
VTLRTQFSILFNDNLFPAKILIISNYSNIIISADGSSAVQHTDKIAENRSKSQEAASLLRRAARILTQNSAESKGCCARNSNMGNTVCRIEFILPQVNEPQPLVTMNFGDYSPCTIGLTIAASFIHLRRSAVEVILGDKRVLLSHKIRGYTIFFVWQTPQVAR